MAYDEALAGRVRSALGPRRRLVEKRMFGGLAFFRRGHMAFGVVGDELMVRVGPAGYQAALGRAGARPMDFTGRPMNGMVYVGRAGLRTAAQLDRWLAQALAFADSLPPKRGAGAGKA